MEKDAIDFGKTNIYRLFGKYFLPTLMGMLSIAAVTSIDGIFIGHGVGSEGIAAVNICVPIFMITTGIGIMMGTGCSVVASIHLSQNKIKAARINTTQAILFATLITFIPTFLMWLYPESASRMLGASEQLLPMVKEYMVWFILPTVCSVWLSIALFIIRLDGSPQYAMWCSLSVSIANTFLDWLFIFPFEWGLMGAAFASSISVSIGGLMSIGYLMFAAKKIRLIRLKLSRRSLHYTIRNIGYQCRIGSAGLIGETTMAVLAFVGNHVFMKYLGNDGIGAFGIGCYYAPFVFMVGNSIAQSAQPIISYNFGLKLYERTQQALRIALMTAIICGLIVTGIFILAPQLLVALFIDTNSNTAHIAIDGFPWFSTAFVFFIINLTYVGYYQSIKQVSRSTCFSLLRGFFFLIPSFLIMPTLMGEKGIWMALCVSEALTTLTIIISHRLFKTQPIA